MISLTMPYKVIPPIQWFSRFLQNANRQLPTVICQLDIYPILTLYIFSWQSAVDGWRLVFSRTSKTAVQWCEHVYIHNTPKQIVMTRFFLLGRSEYCSNGHSYFRWLLLLILWDTGVIRNNYTTIGDTQNTLVSISTSEEKCYQGCYISKHISYSIWFGWRSEYYQSTCTCLGRWKSGRKLVTTCLPRCSLKHMYGHFMNIRAHSGTTNTWKHCINHQVEACTYYVTIKGAHTWV